MKSSYTISYSLSIHEGWWRIHVGKRGSPVDSPIGYTVRFLKHGNQVNSFLLKSLAALPRGCQLLVLSTVSGCYFRTESVLNLYIQSLTFSLASDRKCGILGNRYWGEMKKIEKTSSWKTPMAFAISLQCKYRKKFTAFHLDFFFFFLFFFSSNVYSF